jgi:Flp pilus assembly protein TadG
MPPPTARLSILRRFVRARRGATAVEFAILALPFMVMLFGIVELATTFIASTTLEQATEVAARRIRTGEFQTGGGTTKNDFRQSICDRMSWLSSGCTSKLYIDVRTFASFNGLATSPQANPALFNPAVTCWSPGNPTDIVLVRAYYQWTLFTPLLNAALQNMGTGSGKRLLTATAAFRNEPWDSNLTPVLASCGTPGP